MSWNIQDSKGDGFDKFQNCDFMKILEKGNIICLQETKKPNMSAPPRRCWVGNAASSVCAVGQRTHPAEVQSEPHLPSDVVLGQLVTERIGLENGIVLSFSS